MLKFQSRIHNFHILFYGVSFNREKDSFREEQLLETETTDTTPMFCLENSVNVK